MKIKKGDMVEVLAGNDKGKKGEVLKIILKENRVVVRDVNKRKKAMKPKKQGEQGGIIELEQPINVSNVGYICSKCNKPVRVGYKTVKGEKVRVCKKCDTVIKDVTKK